MDQQTQQQRRAESPTKVGGQIPPSPSPPPRLLQRDPVLSPPTRPTSALELRGLLTRVAREPWALAASVDPASSASSGSGGSTGAPQLQRGAAGGGGGGATEGWEARLESVRAWMASATQVEVEGTWNSVLNAAIQRECACVRAQVTASCVSVCIVVGDNTVCVKPKRR